MDKLLTKKILKISKVGNTLLLTFFLFTDAPLLAQERQKENPINIELMWKADGFSMPESALALPNNEWIYVSNVNGDQPGYISRMYKDGKVENFKWVEGLDNPAGMAIWENRLYIGDGNKLQVINLSSGKLQKPYTSDIAQTLNDVAVSSKGQIFISDVLGGKIYSLNNNRLEVWLEDARISHPNGLFIDGDNLYIGDLSEGYKPDFTPTKYGSVYKINIKNKHVTLLENAYKIGGIDGVFMYKDNLFVTSNPTGELFFVTEKARTKIGSHQAGIADFSIDGNLLYLPNLFTNSVECFEISEFVD